jgi:hypothetical protein
MNVIHRSLIVISKRYSLSLRFAIFFILMMFGPVSS